MHRVVWDPQSSPGRPSPASVKLWSAWLLFLHQTYQPLHFLQDPVGDNTLMRGALHSTLGQVVFPGESSRTPVGDDTLTRGALHSAPGEAVLPVVLQDPRG